MIWKAIDFGARFPAVEWLVSIAPENYPTPDHFENSAVPALTAASISGPAPTIQLLETWLQNQSPSKSMNRIEVPILQLWGIQSRFPPTIHPTIERLKQFPRVTQWLIQESNHELHWQHPRWVAQVTTHFINEENIFSESGNGGVWEVKVT